MQRHPMLRWAVFVTSGLTLVSALALTSTTKARRSSSPVGATAVSEPLPGTTLSHFLRLDTAPSTWAAIMKPLNEKVDACIRAKGYTSSIADEQVYTPVDELRVADPVQFRTLYAYGIVATLRAQASATGGGGPVPPSDELAAREACKATVDYNSEVAAHQAPLEVQHRAADLMDNAAQQDPTYTTALTDWRQCMRTAGLDASALDLTNVENLIGNFEATLIGKGAEGEPTEASRFGPDQLDKIGAYENKVRTIDDTCRNQSGAARAFAQLERGAITQLRKEFPDYLPPA